MVSGSAPIEKEVMTYLRICFCCPIHEGYGLTEVSAAVTMTTADDPTIGHVGAPLKMVRLRLKSIPEMEYLVTDKPYPRGEVVIKSGGVFGGYFVREDKTAEAFEDDGWFRSGDVGMILPNGTLKIIDRSKNIFKLSQGEYIAPEKLENIFGLSVFVEQSFVYGDSLKDCLIAIVVPKQAAIDKFNSEHPGHNALESDEFKR